MNQIEQQGQLQKDLEVIMLRYYEEYDVSLASALGIFQVVAMNMYMQTMEES